MNDLPQLSMQSISIVICTRDRGDRVVGTLESAFHQEYPDFEVILIDQSSSDKTQRAVDKFLNLPRFRYIRSAEQGLSRARNLGDRHARGSIIAFTDDDCLLPMNWLLKIKEAFDKDGRICLVNCNVIAAAYDQTKGFVPEYIRKGEQLVTTPIGKLCARGIGAGMAVRKDHILALGGFDELLGPGSLFPSCEDRDLALRALLAGHSVFETDSTNVIHAGFRTWKQGKPLARRNWVGIGAAYVKLLRCGHWETWYLVLYEAFAIALWQAFKPAFRLKRPHGFRNFVFFWEGFFKGLVHPLDKTLMLYSKPTQPSRVETTRFQVD